MHRRLRYLYDLARAATPSGRRPTVTASRVRPTILRLLDSMTDVPAYVRNARFDILAANTLGRALYAPVFESPLFARRGPVNSARFMFLDPASQEFWIDWEKEPTTRSPSYAPRRAGRPTTRHSPI